MSKDCEIIVGVRDADGRVWCRTCTFYVAVLPRTETERFFGEPPIRVACPNVAPLGTLRP
jgi:hypothetical protein